MYLIIWLIQLGILFIVTFILIFRKRAYIYYYLKLANGKFVPVLLGYIKKNGTIIDICKRTLRKKVGQVVVDKEKGVVRVNLQEEDKFEEVGYVTPEGEIYQNTGNGNYIKIAEVNSDGTRTWRDLWTRLHTEVPINEPEPYGTCAETGRYRHRKLKEVTLLSRASAVLLLYFRTSSNNEIPDYVYYNKITDTALPASVLFTLLFVPIYHITKKFMLFPFLGTELSFILSMYGIYTLLWTTLHFTKEALLSSSDKILNQLMIINRNTGLKKWNIISIIILIIGIIYSVFIGNYVFIPFFSAILTGLIINHLAYTGELWSVDLPYKRITEAKIPQLTPNPESRHYDVTLDSPIRSFTFGVDLYFDPNDITNLRTNNPFHNGNITDYRNSVRYIIDTGKTQEQVLSAVNQLTSESKQNTLTPFEEMQLILDFVQEPTIAYIHDNECQEIGNPDEYIRYPVETLYDKRGDCDCKSALAVSMFLTAGYKTLFIISNDREHAAIAVESIPGLEDIDMDNDGIIDYKGKKYYYCETTGDNWTLGKVPDFMKGVETNKLQIVDFSY